MNKDDYISEAQKQPNSVDADNMRVYSELDFDCTQKFVKQVRDGIQKAVLNNVIDNELTEILVIDDAKPGKIYCLPKIHKNMILSPGRPICNTINTPIMNLSKWIDIQLQTLVKNLPSYIKDSSHFLCKIEQINQQTELPPNAILVTWDVKFLYTNIPHEDGSDALKLQAPKNKTETILEFSKLVLNSNHFKFLGKHYLQKSGTAMGDKNGTKLCKFIYGSVRRQNDEFICLQTLSVPQTHR